jgi:ribosomal protein S18 acetylase RimI-like enzyme
MQCSLRPLTSADLPFLGQMLFEAFFWRVDTPRPAYAEFAAHNAEFHKLISGWGRAGDAGVVAEAGGQPAAYQPVGAAWYRLWTDEVHSYGYVDTQTPEIGIGVAAAWRGRGVGRALLQALLDTARKQGFAQVCLSLEVDNPALRLYQSEGFEQVGTLENAWTMVRILV